jgi:hypothetical protein
MQSHKGQGHEQPFDNKEKRELGDNRKESGLAGIDRCIVRILDGSSLAEHQSEQSPVEYVNKMETAQSPHDIGQSAE